MVQCCLRYLILPILAIHATLLCVACSDDAGDDDDADRSGAEGGAGADEPTTGSSSGPKIGVTADDTPVVINEFMPSNTTGIVDEGGGTGDWIELYNRSDEELDLTGYFVSDDLDNPEKAVLGGLSIKAHKMLLLWADSDEEQGADHLPFNLHKDGEAILLSSPQGELLDSVEYLSATSDVSYARVPDGSGAFEYCAAPTPEAPNDPSCGD